MNHQPPSPLLIRSIHPDDMPALHGILSHPLVAESGLHLPTTEYSETRDTFQKPKPGLHRLVGVLDGQVVAYGLLRHNQRPRLRHIGEPDVYVHPDFWRQGIGGQMLAHLLNLAENWLNLWRLELQSFADNAAAARLAEKFGFNPEINRREAAFGHGRFQDIILYSRVQPPPAVQSRPTTPPPIPPVHVVDASQVIIRPAHPDDIDDVAGLMRDPMVARTTLQLTSQEVWATRKRLGEAPPPGLHRLAAEDNGRVVGLITIYQSQNPRLMHSAGLGMMVSPAYWGLGIGSRLMAAILDIADNWLGLRRVELEVNTDNLTAVHLYQKFGFEIEGTKRWHNLGDGRWADSHSMARLKE